VAKIIFERIVRNDLDLNRIREYIRTNPSRWELDVENQQGAPIERGRAFHSIIRHTITTTKLLGHHEVADE
jgi:hypothetical protein